MKQLVDQALRFLNFADRDVRAFKVLKLSPEIDLATICFHAQQAVEKALKAVLILRNTDPARTHDLNKLAYEIINNGLELPLEVETISKLNPYAVIFRYDDMEIEILTRDEADEILEIMINWATNIINKQKLENEGT